MERMAAKKVKKESRNSYSSLSFCSLHVLFLK